MIRNRASDPHEAQPKEESEEVICDLFPGRDCKLCEFSHMCTVAFDLAHQELVRKISEEVV